MEHIARIITSAGGVERTNNNNSTNISLGTDQASSLKRSAGQVSEQGRSIQTLTKFSKYSLGEFAGRSRFVKTGGEDVKAGASECSMCGDVGFAQQLLLCRRCGYRFQHTYCSKFYPDLDMESWSCEWCLYEVEKNAVGIGATKSKPGKRKAVSLSLTESRHKAFEFLLQIAQDSPTSSSSTANNTTGEKNLRDTEYCGRAVTKTENGLKPGNGYGDLDHGQVARCVKEESSWRLAQTVNWNCKEENSIKSGAQVPKRQRCSHPNKTLDKWRNLPKTKLHCNSSKAIGRRYKLLADVLC